MSSDDGILVKTLRWWRNLWNIRKINEIQTQQINELIFKLTVLITVVDRLKSEQLKIKKELDKLKEGQKTIPIEVVEEITKDTPPELSKADLARITTDRWYDPQMNVEYFVMDINGEKASPDDDTVAEE